MAWAWALGVLGGVVWHLQNLKSNGSRAQQDPAKGDLIEPPQGNTLLQNPGPIILSSPVSHAYESPLLLFTCNRANYLAETLDDIFNNMPRPCRFGCPIIVSEDGQKADVRNVILSYKEKFEAEGIPLLHIQHNQATLTSRGSSDPSKAAYQALAKHYAWALSEVFNGNIHTMLPIPQRVIILEEDIHTAPDFFSYMEATSKLLDEDSSLFAVSAYNDNGHMVSDQKRLLRSDFFPGLGWMMTRSLWKNELESKWPSEYWDDWLREPAQRNGRQVVRPEISRTNHFGSKGGASNNQFGTILERVKLNDQIVDWSKEDLSYLKADAYDKEYGNLIQGSKRVTSLQEAKEAVQDENVWLEYRDYAKFKKLAKKLDIMADEKAMVPRTAYKGVVETRLHSKHLLFLTPPLEELRESFQSIS
jgi:alpha-1,3-mannosyl-glycoprotein beta-1,2-N-acetylglucosaminyltransferase